MISTYQFVINVAIGLKYILGKSRLVTWIQLTIRCCLKYVCTQSPKNLLALLIGIHSPDIYQLKKKKNFQQILFLLWNFRWFKAELCYLWALYTSCCPSFFFFFFLLSLFLLKITMMQIWTYIRKFSVCK